MLVDSIFKSIVANKFDNIKNPYRGGHQREVWYNKKTQRGKKQVYYYGAALWEMAQREKGFLYFITLTTRQHQKFTLPDGRIIYFVQNHPDRFYYEANKSFLRYKGYSYISCVERQRNTQDIHFHLLCFSRYELYNSSDSKREHCKSEVAKLAKLYEVPKHDSIYDITQITDFKGVVSYSSKCFGNHNVKDAGKFGYNSLFECRCFSASRDVSRFFKENEGLWLRRMNREQIDLFRSWLIKKQEDQFFTLYQFNQEIFDLIIDNRELIQTDFKIELV